MASHPQSLVATVLEGAGHQQEAQDGLAGWAWAATPRDACGSESEYSSYHPGSRPRPPITHDPWAS